MRLFLILLFSIFVTTSLFSATSCPDTNFRYSYTIASEDRTGRASCLSDSYNYSNDCSYVDVTLVTGCSYTSSTKYSYHADVRKYTRVTDCPTGQAANEYGLCEDIPCDNSDPFADCDGDGVPNGDDSFPDCDSSDPLVDCDNDGVPNGSDPTPDCNEGDSLADCDGDGVPNGSDPYPNDSTNTGDSGDCQGRDSLKFTFYPTSPIYALGDYLYKPYAQNADSCISYFSMEVDSVVYFADLSPSCERDYCFVHYVTDCSYSASDRLPNGWVYNSSAKTENVCTSFVDGVKYSSSVWDVPNSLSCPNTAFCFLRPVETSPEDSNTENNDSSMLHPDLNSTSLDLAPLLNSQNTTNKHLQDLKDKTDNTNNKLDSLSDINNQILASNKDLNNKLYNLNSNGDKLLSNSDLMNTNLSNMNKSLSTSNFNTKNIHSDLIDANAELDNITNNTNLINNTLNDGLFSDTNPFSDVDFTDGSETFDTLGTEVSDSFGLTYELNPFGLSNLGTANIGIHSFSMLGNTFVIFEPGMLDGFPIVEIRALFMFFFAISGFILVFRTI